MKKFPKVLAAYAPLVLVGALTLLPLLFMAVTSLKSLPETMAGGDGTFWPKRWHWENYPDALGKFHFARYFANTLFLAALRVAGVLFSCSLVAWGFARYRCRINPPLFLLLLGTMMLPAQVTAIPLFILFVKLGLYNTYVPLILPSWLGANAFFIFLLKQFFEAIPEDLLNAARIDGAGEWRIFWTIALPLSRPILWTVAIFTAIGAWNDYFNPLIYLSDERLYPLSLGMTYFQSASQNPSFGTQWNLMMAISLIAIVPVALLFFFAQKSFIRSAMGTSLKQ